MPFEIPTPSMTFEVPLEDGARIRMRRHGNPDGVLSIVNQSDGSYAYYNGTSMATPHVAGVAALLFAQGRTRDNVHDALVDTAVPKDIRQDSDLALGAALSEVEVLAELRKLASKNKTAVQMIGQGYYDTVTPAVIRRNILEAPAWFTASSPSGPTSATVLLTRVSKSPQRPPATGPSCSRTSPV